MTPHKHHDLIVAWAKGAKIQIEQAPGCWADCDHNQPGWWAAFNYRIKPEPKTDVIKYKYISCSGFTFSRERDFDIGSSIYRGAEGNLPNLKLTLDGETGKLKKAEVINEA